MRIATALIGLAFLTCGPVRAATDEEHIRNLERSIAPTAVAQDLPPLSLAARMKQLHVPGVSIAFVHDGKIAWARGFGVTRDGGPPVTPDTIFQAGSISKVVSSAGILRETEKGKLSLDADVRAYLKSWSIPENKFTAGTKITLQQLLSHTAGMTVHGFAGYAQDAALPSSVQILNGAPPANNSPITADHAPGARFNYSGGGYVIAQQVVEDATGIPFAELMHRNLFAPLGMARSSFKQTLSPAQKSKAAIPYRGWGEPVRGGAHRYPEMAPAGLWTTASDLARFVIAVQDGIAGKPQQGFSRALTRQLLSPVATPKMTGIVVGDVPNGYGLGIVTADGDHPFFWHNGQDEGFTSMMAVYRNGDGVVVLTNGDTGGDLAGDIVRTIAREYDWPNFQPLKAAAATAPDIARYTGHYRTKNGRLVVVTREGNALMARQLGDGRSQLLPAGANSFLASGWPGLSGTTRYEFAIGAKGVADALTITQDGDKVSAGRINDNDPQAAWIDALLHRIDAGKQGAGTEAAVRSVIAQLQQGKLDDAKLEKSLADDLRANMAFHRQEARRLGDLRRLTFKDVGPDGNDIYEAQFAHGWAIWRIGIGHGGKIRAAFYSAD